MQVQVCMSVLDSLDESSVYLNAYNVHTQQGSVYTLKVEAAGAQMSFETGKVGRHEHITTSHADLRVYDFTGRRMVLYKHAWAIQWYMQQCARKMYVREHGWRQHPELYYYIQIPQSVDFVPLRVDYYERYTACDLCR
jgi:hypothetical protein